MTVPGEVDGGAVLLLASASPRRAALLTTLGVRFRVMPADLDETPLPGEAPRGVDWRRAS